ncbi:MAG: hypothetical protein COB15_15635 [Flavobacteriales bacterium]|nr:MAG: hypothetical protein COB15_15635 [Flavobacteriales bacterium]
MKRTLLIISIFISTTIVAQSKFTVAISGFSFSPSTLTITAGDTIEFTNPTAVAHWIDGTQTAFPSNLVSFDNQSQSGTGWTYTQVFNTVGAYAYRCGIHASMLGGFTVQAATVIPQQVIEEKNVGFYPNPATGDLFLSKHKSITNVIVYSITGKEVLTFNSITEKLDISTLSAGEYLVKIVTDEEELTQKLIIPKN